MANTAYVYITGVTGTTDVAGGSVTFDYIVLAPDNSLVRVQGAVANFDYGDSDETIRAAVIASTLVQAGDPTLRVVFIKN